MNKRKFLTLLILIFAINFIIISGKFYANLTDIKVSSALSKFNPNENLIDFANKYQIEGLAISNFIQKIYIFELLFLFIGLNITYFIMKKNKMKMINFFIVLLISLVLTYKKLYFNPANYLSTQILFDSFQNQTIFLATTFFVVSSILFYLSLKINQNKT